MDSNDNLTEWWPVRFAQDNQGRIHVLREQNGEWKPYRLMGQLIDIDDSVTVVS